jgi:hypothetical protein
MVDNQKTSKPYSTRVMQIFMCIGMLLWLCIALGQVALVDDVQGLKESIVSMSNDQRSDRKFFEDIVAQQNKINISLETKIDRLSVSLVKLQNQYTAK